jgi:hypothetical protein
MEAKGKCSLCGNIVYGHQARGKDQNGMYVHMDCVKAHGGGAQHSTVLGAQQKGKCSLCGNIVHGHQARGKDQNGMYVHMDCVKAHGGGAVCPPCAPLPSQHSKVLGAQQIQAKGKCSVCGNIVYGHQARGKDQNGMYVHMDCVARGEVGGKGGGKRCVCVVS